ncbi:MAG: hypothetical protein R3Y13_02455 [bacterium]
MNIITMIFISILVSSISSYITYVILTNDYNKKINALQKEINEIKKRKLNIDSNMIRSGVGIAVGIASALHDSDIDTSSLLSKLPFINKK